MAAIDALNRFLAHSLRDEIVEINGHKLYIDVVDGMYPENGLFEEPTTELLKNEVKEGDVVLDIGDDIGYYTCLAAGLIGSSGKVFAFESNPETLSILKKNIELNDLRNVVLVNEAVSDENIQLPFYPAGPHSSFGYDATGNGRPPINVRSIKLDDFFKSGQKIDFVKIDVEGSEGRVLRGMRNLLNKNKDVGLVFEFYPKLLKKAGEDSFLVLRQLTDLGFSLYDIGQESLANKPLSAEQLAGKYPARENAATNLFCKRR